MDSKFITKPTKKEKWRTPYLNRFKVKCLFVTIVLIHYNLSSKKGRHQTHRWVLLTRPHRHTWTATGRELPCLEDRNAVQEVLIKRLSPPASLKKYFICLIRQMVLLSVLLFIRYTQEFSFA